MGGGINILTLLKALGIKRPRWLVILSVIIGLFGVIVALYVICGSN